MQFFAIVSCAKSYVLKAASGISGLKTESPEFKILSKIDCDSILKQLLEFY